jgi:hypothetical protein
MLQGEIIREACSIIKTCAPDDPHIREQLDLIRENTKELEKKASGKT